MRIATGPLKSTSKSDRPPRGHDRLRGGHHFNPFLHEPRDDGSNVGPSKRLSGERDLAEENPRRKRIGDQMRSVEQHQVGGLAPCDRSIPGDERVLATGDALHEMPNAIM